MKTLLPFILLILYAWPYGFSQEVIATSGDYYSSNNSRISWTLGELVVETFESNDAVLTQGFHQGNISITAIQESLELNLEISAFPNPATDMVIVKIESYKSEKLSFTLFDANGKLILKQELNSYETDIPLDKYAPAIYFLKVYDDSKEIKTFKIIKSKSK